MVRIRGYQQKEGSFTNKETGEVITYDNYLVSYESDENSEVTGLYCDTIKVKRDKVAFVGFSTLSEVLNKEVIFGFDMTVPDKPTVNKIILV